MVLLLMLIEPELACAWHVRVQIVLTVVLKLL